MEDSQQHQPEPAILTTKQHFEVLDGMRGIAAIAVVIFHFMEIVFSDYSKNFIGHGFLAVDFFFCLSGFVIGYAYDDRIGKMGIKQFFLSRLIRLHPLIISGSILGLLAFLFDPSGGHPELYTNGKLAILFACSMLLIPFAAMPDRYFNLFGLNAPAWSLFWEYIANMVYAFVLCRLPRRILMMVTIVAAGILCYVAYAKNSLIGGWDGKSFWDGGARIFFSFSAGLLIFRCKWVVKSSIGFTGLSVLLAVAFMMPWTSYNGLTEALVVIFWFPLLISLGAGTFSTGWAKKLCIFAGKISYPLYMTHYVALWMFGNYYPVYKPGTAELFFIVGGSTLLLLALSYAIMKLYDEPLRKYLNAKRKIA